MKRLIFEFQAAVVALLRTQTDPKSDPSSRKSPPAERNSRIAMQRERLRGLQLSLKGRWRLLTRSMASSMACLSQTPSYLPPGKCITQKIMSAKPHKELKLGPAGNGVVVKETQTDQGCTASTELDVMEAMTCRHWPLTPSALSNMI